MSHHKMTLYTILRSFVLPLRRQVNVPPKPQAKPVNSHLDLTQPEKTAMERYGFLPRNLQDLRQQSKHANMEHHPDCRRINSQSTLSRL